MFVEAFYVHQWRGRLEAKGVNTQTNCCGHDAGGVSWVLDCKHVLICDYCGSETLFNKGYPT
jgi:hypothetical protein